MTEDRFLDRLRGDAEPLRFDTGDDVMWTRLAARIRDGVLGEPTVAQMLARWFRPITASFVALALAAVLSLTWTERSEAASRTESLSANSTLEIAVDGDTYNISE